MIGLGTIDTFVDLTQEAKQEIRRQLALHKDQDVGVRIIVVLDRYSGFVFDLEFDKPGDEDYVAKIDQIPVLTNKSFLEYVRGMKIDYDPEVPTFLLKNEQPAYNCVPGAKFECPTCNLYEERKDDPAYVLKANE